MSKFDTAAKEILALGSYIHGVQDKEFNITQSIDIEFYRTVQHYDILDILLWNDIKAQFDDVKDSWDIKLESAEDRGALMKAIIKFNHHKMVFIQDVTSLKSVSKHLQKNTQYNSNMAYKMLCDLSSPMTSYDFSRKHSIRTIFQNIDIASVEMTILAIDLLVESMEAELERTPLMKHKYKMEKQRFPILSWRNIK